MSLGDFVVMRTSQSVLTQTQTVQPNIDMRCLTTGTRSEKWRRQAISSLCECHAVCLHKPRQYSLLQIRRLTTGTRCEKCVVRRFHRCANVIQCTYTNPDSTVQPTTHLRYMVLPIAARLQTCTACYCTECCRQM